MNDLTDRIAGLSPAKRKLLELRREQMDSGPSGERSISPRNVRESIPLSFPQQRLWFLDQLEPNGHLYNISRATRFAGALDVPALSKAFDAILARHEVLRTTFAAPEGVPVQIVGESRTVPMKLIDLSRAPAAVREQELQKLLQAEARRPFNLAADLMLRPSLVKLGDEDHVLMLVLHHIASDGWSMGVLFRELGMLYGAFLNGKPSPLPQPAIQYADYAVWQRRWFQGQVLENQLSYWKKKLADVAALELPTDRPRSADRTRRGAWRTSVLPESLTASLKTLSQRQGATLFMTLLAAFQVLLHRYTGQEDIVVGSPVAGRGRIETESLIGFFINTLVLRTDFSGAPTFRELLKRVRETCLDAYTYQDLPFEKLVEELQVKRDGFDQPLFQVMFALQNFPMQPAAMPGLTSSPVKIQNDSAKFDLTLAVVDEAGSLRASLEYNADLFDASTIERMAGHFETLLHSIVENPGVPVSELCLVTKAERRELLSGFSDAEAASAKEACIHDLFAAAAVRAPDATAAVFEGKQLTYGELNQRANQLAHYLRRLQVGPDVPVGICLDKSFETLVALLGVLKAGGTYLPLDPAHPRERLSFLIEDSRTPLVLTKRALLGKLPETKLRVVCLDTEWRAVLEESGRDPSARVAPDNLAYVIYTSGSTGTPKGVQITHRALAGQSIAAAKHYALQPGDRVLQFASLSFDVSVEEIFPSWLSGAAVVLSREQPPTISEFLEFLRREQVTVVNLPAPYWHEWVAAAPGGDKLMPDALRLVIVGSDRVLPERFSAWQKTVGGRLRWINAYGPTEATVTSTFYEPATGGDKEIVSVPIGRPMAKQVYILDRALQPVPVGVRGELYIGGATLARGYLNNPERTAEKFIPDPFSAELGARLYQTGDLARWRADGNIEFLGRADDQVKIRGYRIEPGEIEATLRRLPDVRAAAVIARDSRAGEKQLIAYIVLSEARSDSADAAREFLQRKLPGYMIPAIFVVLPALPLTPNGKLDRRALPVPAESGERSASHASPADPVECQLVQIWEELLCVRPIGVRDDFFALGGHSLLAVQLMHRIEQIYGRKLPLAVLFDGATIRQLSSAIVSKHVAECRSPIVRVQGGGSKPPFFFLHGDFLGGGVYTLNLARGLGEDQPFYVLNPHGVDGKPMPDSIEAMASSYIQTIQFVQPHGPYFLGGYCNGGVVAYEMARQLNRQKEKVGLVALVAAPVNNTPPMRLLRHFISTIAYLCRFDSEQNTTLFLQSRELYRYYTDRIEDVAQWPLSRRLAWALRQSTRAVRQGPRLLAAAIARLTRAGRQAVSEELFERKDPLGSTGRAMKSYIPRRYAGRVVLFQPREGTPDDAEDPTMGWGRIASAVEVQMVEGGHMSCVSTHVQSLAAQIRASLRVLDEEEILNFSSCCRSGEE